MYPKANGFFSTEPYCLHIVLHPVFSRLFIISTQTISCTVRHRFQTDPCLGRKRLYEGIGSLAAEKADNGLAGVLVPHR